MGGSAGVFEWTWNGTPVQVGYDVRGPDGDEGGGAVLLLPAFSTVSTRHEMRPLAERLASRLRTVALDWPGFGLGQHPGLDHGGDSAGHVQAIAEKGLCG